MHPPRCDRRWIRSPLLALALLVPATLAFQCPPRRVIEAGREPCQQYARDRVPLFGETHAHTAFSFDAVQVGVRSEPRDAYAFAKGAPIGLPPYDASGNPLRTTQLHRPLDWAVVTDHAEYFGETQICFDSSYPGFASSQCTFLRAAVPGPAPGDGLPLGFLVFALPLVSPGPRFAPVCGPGNADCLAEAASVWGEIQAAAEEHYDRSSACEFTTFVGYEWTANTNQKNLHRNVVFRNEIVPALPTSYYEASTPEALFAALENDCLDGLPGCDVLTIPHNSNLSGGAMFDAAGATAEQNAMRAFFEPLVEMTQHKGASECRTGVGNDDEACAFESVDRTALGLAPPNPNAVFPPLNFVRNALLEGLVQEDLTGVNPYRFGFVAGTDTHNATPGKADEDDYPGHIGYSESTTQFRVSQAQALPVAIEGNPGGLAVLWAEENSRESLWRAMTRREAYATSGTRPVVRFFGGFGLPRSMCEAPHFAKTGYFLGTPMGGELHPPHRPRFRDSPRFAVLATQDPGAPGSPGTPLQRIQVVKGWTDGNGDPHQLVYDVAGDAQNGAGVDAECRPEGEGFASLCTVWEDPDFDAAENAFYYARVLENPTCRWSARQCVEAGITCDGTIPSTPGFEGCCREDVPKQIQERAWTSPIWYVPQG